MVYYARKVKQNLRGFSAPLGAPAMGAVSRRLTEGSPGGRECQWVKEKAGYRTPLSLRGQFANWPWQSASLLRHARNTAVSRRNGFPRRFAPRNDSGCLGRLFLFHSACVVTLATPSAFRATSPKRGSATRQEFNTGATGQRSAAKLPPWRPCYGSCRASD